MIGLLALVLVGIHFGVPLSYYLYLKRHLNRPWKIKVSEEYQPPLTVIIPTHNEAKLIEQRLDNISKQNYPMNDLEVIVVDSSTDETIDIVKTWASKNSDLRIKLVKEPVRKGMVPALNYALYASPVSEEVLVFTDADASWESDALKTVAKYFAHSEVGALTACIIPAEGKEKVAEEAYRDYYNVLRVAESKFHSTPVHNGVLMAFRTELLYKIDGLPEYTGNADSTPASIIAFMGYRAIQADDVVATEPIRGVHSFRKIRRAQHLILHFLKTKKYAKEKGLYKHSNFDNIWRMEWWLHIVNPWIMFVATIMLVVSAMLYEPIVPAIILAIGLSLTAMKPFRMWIVQQLYLMIATLRNLKTKKIMWEK